MDIQVKVAEYNCLIQCTFRFTTLFCLVLESEGQPFNVQDMQDPHKSSLVASLMARWHKVVLPGPRTSKLFKTMCQWLDAG